MAPQRSLLAGRSWAALRLAARDKSTGYQDSTWALEEEEEAAEGLGKGASCEGHLVTSFSKLTINNNSKYHHKHHKHHHHNNNNSNSKRARLVAAKLGQRASWCLVLLLALLLLLAIGGAVERANALNCYHCSSADNPGCDEAFTARANFTDTDCEKAIGRPAKVCRKIVQYIENKQVVIRSCGFIDDHQQADRKPMCYKRSGTFALMMESCVCYEDNCNHSASLVPSKPLSLLSCALALTTSLIGGALWHSQANIANC